MLSSTANIRQDLVVPTSKFTLQTIFKSGIMKGHDPLILGNKWFIQAMPPPRSHGDSSVFDIWLNDLTTKDKGNNKPKQISQLQFLTHLLPLGENTFAALVSEQWVGLASYFMVFQIRADGQVEKKRVEGKQLFNHLGIKDYDEESPGESIVQCFSLPENGIFISLIRGSSYGWDKPDTIVVNAINDLLEPGEQATPLKVLQVSMRLPEEHVGFHSHDNKLFFKCGPKIFLEYFWASPQQSMIFESDNIRTWIKDFFYAPESKTLIYSQTDGHICFIDKEFNKVSVPFHPPTEPGESVERPKEKQEIGLRVLKDGKHFIAWNSKSGEPKIYAWNIEKRKCVEILELSLNADLTLSKTARDFQVVNIQEATASFLCVQFMYFIDESFYPYPPDEKNIPMAGSTIIHLNLFTNNNLLTAKPVQRLLEGPAFYSMTIEDVEDDEEKAVATDQSFSPHRPNR
jgi:hypothetical protein